MRAARRAEVKADGAGGDADLLAALTAIEKIKDKYPDCGIELGIASECTLGMHGELTYRGKPSPACVPKTR